MVMFVHKFMKLIRKNWAEWKMGVLSILTKRFLKVTSSIPKRKVDIGSQKQLRIQTLSLYFWHKIFGTNTLILRLSAKFTNLKTVLDSLMLFSQVSFLDSSSSRRHWAKLSVYICIKTDLSPRKKRNL